MTRIVGSLVIRNEKGRYLEKCIRWHQKFLDEIFVYDDQSDDGSAELARDLGCTVVVRADGNESFMSHEGYYRWDAWLSMESEMDLSVGDWIYSFDADEFLVSYTNDVRGSLEYAIERSKSAGRIAALIQRPEVFKVADGDAYIRMDGFWDTIVASRLFAYKPHAKWNLKAMGCGSEPLYLFDNWKSRDINFGFADPSLAMLHYGYAREEDQKIKHERYTSLLDHGHNDKHVNSIITDPVLQKWEGPTPEGMDAV